MKCAPRLIRTIRLFSFVTFAFSAILGVRVEAQGIATPPLQITDVPRETQAGSGPGRYVPPVPANAQRPTLWLIGDSTVRNGSKGDNGPGGQWGWGAPITAYFDLDKINVVNRALGGTSSRSFYNDQWRILRPLIKQGDFIVIQFGANDSNPQKGSLGGVDDRAEVKGDEAVHSYGWYLKQFVAETRGLGAMPIICSLTPRKSWSENGTFVGGGNYREWAEQAARESGAHYVPLNEIISQKYESLGPQEVDNLFVPAPKERLHTGWEGAVVNAESVIAGLKAIPGNPFEQYFSERSEAIKSWQRS